MEDLTEDGRSLVEEIAARHEMSVEAVQTLLRAVAAGGGSQAQFSHPELGGMGQWSQGGMIMIGDMFNNGLKYRVDRLAGELAELLRSKTILQPKAPADTRSGREGVSLFVPGGGFSAGNWPPELGQASSAGGQNDLHYAYFPDSRRLAIRKGGHITLYDTGDHQIGGVSQAQGGDQTLTFTSQHGTVRVADLPKVEGAKPDGPAPKPAAEADGPSPQHAAEPASALRDDIFTQIERLAELHRKGILTDGEYTQKKADLLARL